MDLVLLQNAQLQQIILQQLLHPSLPGNICHHGNKDIKREMVLAYYNQKICPYYFDNSTFYNLFSSFVGAVPLETQM